MINDLFVNIICRINYAIKKAHFNEWLFNNSVKKKFHNIIF